MLENETGTVYPFYPFTDFTYICKHIMRSIHAPIRQYRTDTGQMEVYYGESDVEDPITDNMAFEKEILEIGNENYPILYDKNYPVYYAVVNVIAPIMTEQNGGAAWKQTIFYPFMHASKYGRGTVLKPVVTTTVHDTKEHENVTDMESVAVFNEEKEELTIFAVNRNLDEDIQLTADVRGVEGYKLKEHIVLEHNDMKICNGAGKELVCPKTTSRSSLDGGIVSSLLQKASWNVICLGK